MTLASGDYRPSFGQSLTTNVKLSSNPLFGSDVSISEESAEFAETNFHRIAPRFLRPPVTVIGFVYRPGLGSASLRFFAAEHS
jgi:hypothetical protein